MIDGKNQDASDSVYEDGLCIPQDRLEDIDFFPDFNDDFIRLSEVLLPELEYLTSVDDDIGWNQESGDVESNYFDRKDSVDDRELSSLDSEVSFDDIALQVSSQHNGIKNDNIGVLLSKYKKPRTKKPRKENRKLTIPLFIPRLKTKKRRRCVHCHAEKTPQWRMGPMGRNTLCNACGLRYKSGELVPEYRPAASPSFDSTKHSNFYRRIMQKKLCEDGDVVNG